MSDFAYQQAPHVPPAFQTRARVLDWPGDGTALVRHLTDVGKRLSEPDEVVPRETLVSSWDECIRQRPVGEGQMNQKVPTKCSCGRELASRSAWRQHVRDSRTWDPMRKKPAVEHRIVEEPATEA